jgi:hypothetical protein
VGLEPLQGAAHLAGQFLRIDLAAFDRRQLEFGHFLLDSLFRMA